MKRIVLVLLAATLGVSLPASASAQRVRDLVDQVLQAQQQQQQGPPRGSKGNPDNRNNNNDNRGNDNRGNDNRGRGNDNRGNGNGNNGGGNDNRRPAPPQPGENWRPPQSNPSRDISMSQAIRIVEQSAGPGHHLDGSREERGGRSIYRIQWATDRGERRDYYVDAQTGAIVGGR